MRVLSKRLFSLGLLFFLLTIESAFSQAVIGQKAPKLDSVDLQSKIFSLESFKGNVVLLNFWATWCPPCLEELPSLEALNRYFGSKPFSLVAVSVDKDVRAVKAFLNDLSRQPSFLILMDPQGDAVKRFGTERFPESYLIDSEGHLVKKFVGALDWMDPQILGQIEQVLAKIPKNAKKPLKSQ